MKTNKQRTNPIKKILLKIVALLILAAVCLIVLEKLQITNFITQKITNEDSTEQPIDYNPPTAEQKAAGELQKEKSADNITNNELGISLTSLNVDNDPIQIRAAISGAISNNGTCTLTLTQGEIIVAKAADTYALPNSSTCQGFDIAKNELADGVWQFNLTVNVGDKESSITDNFKLE